MISSGEASKLVDKWGCKVEEMLLLFMLRKAVEKSVLHDIKAQLLNSLACSLFAFVFRNPLNNENLKMMSVPCC